MQMRPPQRTLRTMRGPCLKMRLKASQLGKERPAIAFRFT